MKQKKWTKFALAMLAAAALTACEAATEMKTKTQKVELGDAESVDVKIRMGAGELSLEGGASALMEGTFRCRFERRLPEVDYQAVGRKGRLSITQRKRSHIFLGGGGSKNTWDIRLNERVPMDMEIDLGAGRSSLDLRNFSVKHLDIDMGVGELNLDLSSERSENLDVKIDGGIGHAEIYLPEAIGVRAEIDGGLGSVQASRFHKHGHVYTNDAYGKAEFTIDIRIDAGIGSIDLKLH